MPGAEWPMGRPDWVPGTTVAGALACGGAAVNPAGNLGLPSSGKGGDFNTWR